jgi:tetratricopeptide (TPR) repeat protein
MTTLAMSRAMSRSSNKTLVGLVFMATACRGPREITAHRSTVETTNSVIAIENLDQQIAQLHDDPEVVDFLLVRSRFLADYEALDRAYSLAERRSVTGRDLLARARVRSAVHRFADALADVDAAERRGMSGDEALAVRASILVATGKAAEVTSQLEANLRRHPGYASRSALAGAYAALGRLADADRLYAQALADLDTSLPFPYAWIYFARGLMWAEQGKDRARAAPLYAQALAYLPEFSTANIHLAEIEIARGDTGSAMARLDRVVRSSGEPEALALLGLLHVRTADSARGTSEISRAQERYESRLGQHVLAFADHASEFYLGPGADPERAWRLARMNLANRHTERAIALAIKAAAASGHREEAYALSEKSP